MTSNAVRAASRIRLAIELALGFSLLLVAVIGLLTSVVPLAVVVGALAVGAVVLWRVGQDVSGWTRDRGAVVPPAGAPLPGNPTTTVAATTPPNVKVRQNLRYGDGHAAASSYSPREGTAVRRPATPEARNALSPSPRPSRRGGGRGAPRRDGIRPHRPSRPERARPPLGRELQARPPDREPRVHPVRVRRPEQREARARLRHLVALPHRPDRAGPGGHDRRRLRAGRQVPLRVRLGSRAADYGLLRPRVAPSYSWGGRRHSGGPRPSSPRPSGTRSR